MIQPKALIFDLDDTLFDSTHAYASALAPLGLGLKNARYLKARATVKAQLPPRHVSARNRLLYFKELITAQHRFSPRATLRMIERYERGLRADIERQWRVLDRVRLFSWLHRRFPLVLLSNENTRTQLVKLMGVDPTGRFFTGLITSEEIGVEKPARRAFSVASRLLGVPARQCMMIGDDYNNDIRPALALGMRAVLTREFVKDRAPLHTRLSVISRLDDLKGLLS